jgi:hypothetical protein
MADTTMVSEKQPSTSESLNDVNKIAAEQDTFERDVDVEDPPKAETVKHRLALGLDGVYAEKAHIISQAMTDIGMNAWQYEMWVLCGFGWIVDNVRLVLLWSSCAWN